MTEEITFVLLIPESESCFDLLLKRKKKHILDNVSLFECSVKRNTHLFFGSHCCQCMICLVEQTMENMFQLKTIANELTHQLLLSHF